MAKDAGFDIKIQSTEFATSLNLADKGQFEAYVLAWSGRADPDGNLHTMLACKGPTNYAGYCKDDVEALINESRTSLDPARRAAAYDKIAQAVAKDRPIVYLYPPQLAVGAQREAQRPAYRAGRHGAGAGLEDELRMLRRMLKFLLRRLATIVPTLFFVSILIFGLQQLLPGDPAIALAGEERDPETIQLSKGEIPPG